MLDVLLFGWLVHEKFFLTEPPLKFVLLTLGFLTSLRAAVLVIIAAGVVILGAKMPSAHDLLHHVGVFKRVYLNRLIISFPAAAILILMGVAMAGELRRLPPFVSPSSIVAVDSDSQLIFVADEKEGNVKVFAGDMPRDEPTVIPLAIGGVTAQPQHLALVPLEDRERDVISW